MYYQGEKVSSDEIGGGKAPGAYKFEVVLVEEKTSNTTQKVYLQVKLQCSPLDGKGSPFDVRFVNWFPNHSEFVRQKFDRFLTILGCVDGNGTPCIDSPNDMIGKKGVVVLQHEEFEGKTGIGKALKPLDFGGFYNESKQSAKELVESSPATSIDIAIEKAQITKTLDPPVPVAAPVKPTDGELPF